MNEIVKKIETQWHERLAKDYPDRTLESRQAIVRWLLGEDLEGLGAMNEQRLKIKQQGMEYRYLILHHRYWGVSSSKAYQNLLNRLGSLMVLRNKIRTWVSMSRDRRRAVADVLEELIQEMINSDRNIQASIAWIRQCTDDPPLRNTLLFTSIEEYCMRPIRNQPLLVYRFVNYLRRSQRGGMTQVPQQEYIKMISEEITLDEGDSPVSLLDNEALENYQDQQEWEEQQMLRQKVQQEFEQYLADKLDPLAVNWFQLYLQGHSQEVIAQKLNVPVKQIYRLREKINYHAIKIFSLKARPELVANWLQISLQQHNLGLTPQQWDTFWGDLSSTQQQIVTFLKQGEQIDAIAQSLNLKKSQVMSEWTKSYLLAQNLRN